MNDDAPMPARQAALRYFEMWNTGDTSIAPRILSPDWIDHAHPEIKGPHDVQRSVETIRAARPEIHFEIEAVLGGGVADNGGADGAGGELLSVVGGVRGLGVVSAADSRLIWLIQFEDGLMSQMWTYRAVAPAPAL